MSFLCLCLTVSGLAKVAIFTTNVDAENQTLINHKCVCGALNRHFCQTRVTSWPSVCRCCSVHILQCLGALAWWLFWIFFALVCALEKNTNVPPNALAYPVIPFINVSTKSIIRFNILSPNFLR